ncbi:MAG: 50S ribosomal protein L3 [Desulfobacteraceae bacterium 4572_123]|nr:MAG: 50S ribosomal protein L3 [Desulfobacteraceae bacterium 4572_123]
MNRGLIGKKLGMMNLFSPEGNIIPVTVVQAGPCIVTQVKTMDTDGYNAIQLGFGERKKTSINKPLQGHYKKSGGTPYELLREFKVNDPEKYETGQNITVDMFSAGELVDVSGRSKGRGFSGVMKRHGFAGGRKTHGSKSHRIPGSIGCSAWPAKVIKGKKMPGRYGFELKTTKNLTIIDIRTEENLVFLKGAVPGSRNSMVTLQKKNIPGSK